MSRTRATSKGSSKKTPSASATGEPADRVEGRVWEIEISGQPQLQRGRFGHWGNRMRHDRDWQERVAWMLRGKGLRGALLLEHVSIVCMRFGSGKEPDRDNLAISFKPLLDALKPMSASNRYGVGLIRDDSPDVIAYQTYAWQKVTRHAESVTLRIAELL